MSRGMSHGGNSHQRRKARRLESRRRVSWREEAIRLWGYVPQSVTEIAILTGGQWGKTACFDRCPPPSTRDHSASLTLQPGELRHGARISISAVATIKSGGERHSADLNIWGRPDMVVVDDGKVEMVDLKLKEVRDE